MPDKSDSKQCVICKEEINKRALKCTHCDSFQDWRRYISVNTNVLAFVIALLSLVTALVALLQSVPDKATGEDTKFGWISSRATGMRIWAVNDGDRSAILSADGMFTVTGANGNTKKYDAITRPRNNSDGTDYIIMPGKPRAFLFQWAKVHHSEVVREPDKKVHLTVTITGQDGIKRTVDLPTVPLIQ